MYLVEKSLYNKTYHRQYKNKYIFVFKFIKKEYQTDTLILQLIQTPYHIFLIVLQ